MHVVALSAAVVLTCCLLVLARQARTRLGDGLAAGVPAARELRAAIFLARARAPG